MVIRTAGNYTLEANTTYYFDLEKNNSYLWDNRSRELLTLYFPTKIKDGETIVLIDKNDRFGWGNLSYDIRFVVGDTMIVGDLSDQNLFRFRGGYVILIWNEKEDRWESNGEKGTIENDWNGWYRLVYKGMTEAGLTTEGYISTTIFPSYLRIDATQNPVLITTYGGTEMYPINLIIKSEIGSLDEKENTITFPVYPFNLNLTMKVRFPVMVRQKNGIVMDYKNGGGWMRDESLSLSDNPSDLHELN